MRSFLRLILMVAAVGLAARAVWIPAKAVLAQALLQRAWLRTLAGQEQAKAWSWADTWPVASLRAPAHGIELVVLEGASGEALAFGPAHVAGTARPGEWGNCVVSGHRDTHFRFLARVEIGERLILTPGDGIARCYRVTSRRVVRDDDASVLADADGPTLTLVTCYPFDAVLPGGRLRFVVRAERGCG